MGCGCLVFVLALPAIGLWLLLVGLGMNMALAGGIVILGGIILVVCAASLAPDEPDKQKKADKP